MLFVVSPFNGGAAADPLIGQGPRGSRKSTKFRPILDKIRSKIDKIPSNFGSDHCILQLFARPKIRAWFRDPFLDKNLDFEPTLKIQWRDPRRENHCPESNGETMRRPLRRIARRSCGRRLGKMVKLKFLPLDLLPSGLNRFEINFSLIS